MFVSVYIIEITPVTSVQLCLFSYGGRGVDEEAVAVAEYGRQPCAGYVS